jgi:DNA-binding transcriptional ArsR family regulator
MGASVDLDQLTRRRLRPLVDVHASAVVLAVEAVAVGPGEPWAASILDRLGPPHRRALKPMAASGLVPDIVLDVEHHRRTWRRRLTGVAQAQPRDLVAELAFDGCPGLAACWREVLRAPERWLTTVAVAVGRVLPVAHALLAADRVQLRRLVARIGVADEPDAVGALLADLHSRTQISDGQWTLPAGGPALSPADEGLVVVPALTTPDRSMVARRGQTVTTLFAGVSTTERDHVALTTLLGGTRVALMRSLTEPRTMTELADRLSLIASMVSYHAAALERMELVTRSRRGRSVTVRRTPRGAQLLALYGADRLSGRHDPSVVAAIGAESA